MSPRNDSSRPGKKSDPQAGDERPPGPFDVRTVKSLISLMTQNDLSEIDLRDGAQRLRLRRGALKPVVAMTPSMAAPASAAASTAAPSHRSDTPAAPAKHLLEIKSPTPGTFYSSAKPGEPPFVKVGSKVSTETVVCLIEAMKIFNEIQAEVSGVIVEVLVENQQSVEYGTVLFRIDPAG